MRDKLPQVAEAGGQLLVVDPHEHWAAQHLLKETGNTIDDVKYPLLTDLGQRVSATYGVAFQMRIHTELSNRPATFIIDRAGVIRYARRATSYADRPTPDEIMAELKKLD